MALRRRRLVVIFDPLLLDLPDQFETERLTVHEAIVETLDDLRRFPWAMPWAMEPPSVERAESFCRRGAANWLLRADLPMLLFRKNDRAFVGSSGLHRFD